MTPYWTLAIARAKKRGLRGYFTPVERSAAQNWVTCACGRQDPRIPRSIHDEGEPVDAKLLSLGRDFSEAIDDNDVTEAERILAAIEKRAAEVLAEVAAHG